MQLATDDRMRGRVMALYLLLFRGIPRARRIGAGVFSRTSSACARRSRSPRAFALSSSCSGCRAARLSRRMMENAPKPARPEDSKS